MVAIDDGLTTASAVQPDPATAWTGCNAQDAALRCWGDEAAVYHSATGSTHLLTAAAGRLLQLLIDHPAPRPVAGWADELASVGMSLDLDEVSEILAGLEAVGLARTVSP